MIKTPNHRRPDCVRGRKRGWRQPLVGSRGTLATPVAFGAGWPTRIEVTQGFEPTWLPTPATGFQDTKRRHPLLTNTDVYACAEEGNMRIPPGGHVYGIYVRIRMLGYKTTYAHRRGAMVRWGACHRRPIDGKADSPGHLAPISICC
jgi:hypothetical protein